MKPSKNEIMNQQFFSEKMFTDKLVNKIVVMWAALATIAFVLTQLRAAEIGWTVRDIIFLIILITSISTALAHRKLSTQFKAMSVIILSLTVGVTEIYTHVSRRALDNIRHPVDDLWSETKRDAE